jgi:hypothetical protein
MKRCDAARLLDISPKQVSRLLERYNLEGLAWLEHKGKDKPSSHRKPQRVKEEPIGLLKGDCAGMGPTLARDFFKDDHGIKLSTRPSGAG